MAKFFDYSELTGGKKGEKKDNENILNKGFGAIKKGLDKAKNQYRDIAAPSPIKTEKKTEQKPLVKQSAVYERGKKVKYSNPLMKLAWMIKKDFKLLIRSKTSALIVLLGPLVIILLAGLAFNTNSFYNLKVGIFSSSYSDLTNQVKTDLGDSQYVVIQSESEEKCLQGVRLGEFHVCAIFPPDMNVENAKENTINFYVDESRLNLAYLVSSAVRNKVAARSSELSLGLTNTLVETIDKTKTEIDTKGPVLDDINSKNKESANSLDNIYSSLNTFNFAFNESGLNFTQIDDELDDVKAKANVSGSVFKDLEKMLTNLKISVSDAQLVLGEAKLLRDNSVSSIGNVKTSIQESISGVNQIKESFDQIKTSIGAITITDAETIVSPIKTNVNTVTGEQTHLSFLFPTLVVLVIMFVSVLGAATLVIREKNTSAYFRNFITPTSELLFMIGLFLTNLILVFVQILILLGFSMFFFKEDVMAIFGSSLLVLVVASCAFILLGMFIGYIFKNEETSTLGAVAAASLMLFFSNTILPIETLPGVFRTLVDFNPFVLAEGAFKKIVLFGADFAAISLALLYLLGFVAAFFILAFVAREVAKSRLA